MNYRDWYFEEYDDQSAEDFDYVGVADKEPVPISDLINQVAEYRRLFGSDVTVYVYNSAGVPCGAVM